MGNLVLKDVSYVVLLSVDNWSTDAMITACMSGRSRRSLYPLPDPESSEYRSTFEVSDERVFADLRDLE